MKDYRLIIFDLDGTLADTSEGIYNSIRYTQEKMNLYPPETEEQMRSHIGPPVEESYNRIFGLTGERLHQAAAYHKEYALQKGLYEARLYDGIPELLAQLKPDHRLAVATLKFEETANKMLTHLGIAHYFDIICGAIPGQHTTKLDTLQRAMQHCPAIPNQTLLIGDSQYDAIGAKQAGIDFLAVTYGFGFKNEECTMNNAVDLTSSSVRQMHNQLIEKLNKQRKSLYKIVLSKKQEVDDISSNPTLDCFDLEYCNELDNMTLNDRFVFNRVNACIKELQMAGGIDFNNHYINAYDIYNEAVVYSDLQRKELSIQHIPETTTSTSDFMVEFSFDDGEGSMQSNRVNLEVKSLAFWNGNNEYRKVQRESLESKIRIEEQCRKGKHLCVSEYTTAPLGNNDGISTEIDKLRKKINNNIKIEQFKNKDDIETILYIDFGQYFFPFLESDCLPVYPDVLKKCSVSGRLWMLAFGREKERIFMCPEFEGKSCFDKNLTQDGILNCHDYVSGIIFCSGTKLGEKTLYGFYRDKDRESTSAIFIHKVCDFFNDDCNSFGFKYYEKNGLKLLEDCRLMIEHNCAGIEENETH